MGREKFLAKRYTTLSLTIPTEIVGKPNLNKEKNRDVTKIE